MKKKSIIYLLILLVSFVFIQTVNSNNIKFSDIQPDKWYYETVNNAYENGYIKGYDDGTFKPENTISNCEFVSIIAQGKNIEFSTKNQNHWAEEIMQIALKDSWYDWDEIPPTNNGEYFDQPIERKLAVKIMMRSLMPDTYGDYGKWSSQINDFSTLDGRYYDSTFAAYEAGIIKGDNYNNFNPNDSLTRAEACAMITRAFSLQNNDKNSPTYEPLVPTRAPEIDYNNGGVSSNGQLHVNGIQLSNQNGDPILLRGMSSHGMQWFGQFASHGAIKTTRDYGANIFRIAMYTKESGYLDKPSVKTSVIQAIDDAISLDMYVIVDWHILSDNNPQTYTNQAKEFFSEIALRYQNNPSVIYEICNEPNGSITWSDNIRPYAMEVIPVIREISPSAIIIVGTGTWSQDVDHVSQNPLPFDNVMYSLHFYAGTHGADLQNKVDHALASGTPVFASEWGASQASGNGGAYINEASQWLDFLNIRGISWVNWSLCDKNESSAALMPGSNPNGGWTESDLTESGKFVFSSFGL